MAQSLEKILNDEYYTRCLELARQVQSSSGYGAVMIAFFEDGSTARFEGRSMRKRPGQRYASGGYCEHAENVVINDALEYARSHDTSLIDAELYVAGFENGTNYICIEPRYTCMMCAAQIRRELPEDAEVFVPTAHGWVGFRSEEAYQSALRIRRQKKNATDFREDNSVILKSDQEK